MEHTYKTKKFIEKAIIKHNYTYDYSLVDYKNVFSKIKIFCKKHGEFLQTPTNHLSGSGCPECGKEKFSKSKTLTTEKFIEKVRKIHDNKYDYTKVEYISTKSKIIIICPEHGEFLQTPNSHLKSGCLKCGFDKTRKEVELVISQFNKIHNNKYDYSKVEYISCRNKVVIICPEHGEFLQNPKVHLEGSGCPKCAGNVRLTTEEFIRRSNLIHNNLYDYSKTEIKNNTIPVIIICKKHGEFLQRPSGHYFKKDGCPKCKTSKGEQKIKSCLEQMSIKVETQKKFFDCLNIKELPFDFYLPEYNLCIEYDGQQHFDKNNFLHKKEGSFEIQIKCDEIKNDYCFNKNIKLIRIPFTDFDKINVDYLKELFF